MKEFEEYLPGSWFAHGMEIVVKSVRARPQDGKKRDSKWKIAIMASAFSLGAMVLSVHFTVDPAGSSIISRYKPDEAAPKPVSTEVPPGYWPRLAAAYKNARSLSQSVTDYSAPLV